MTARSRLLLLTALLIAGASSPTRADDSYLLIEWTDHAVDPKALPGNPYYQRMLHCQPADPPMKCELTTVAVVHGMIDNGCPLMVNAMFDRTSAGLRVSRRGDDIDVESELLAATLKLHVHLSQVGGPPPIVQQASGVLVTKPLGGERARAIELVALVQSTKGLEAMREFYVADMKCSKVSFVAAKQAGK